MLRSIWFLAVLALVINMMSWVMMYLRSGEMIADAWPKPNQVAKEADYVPFWDFSTAAIESLIDDLKAQNKTLDERRDAISKIEARVTSERTEIERLRNEIRTYEQELMRRILRVEASEERNLKTLAATYSEMPPASVVAIFAQMDDFFVAKILSLMKTDKVSAIFEQMVRAGGGNPQNVQRVAALSERLRLLDSNK